MEINSPKKPLNDKAKLNRRQFSRRQPTVKKIVPSLESVQTFIRARHCANKKREGNFISTEKVIAKNYLALIASKRFLFINKT